MPSSNKRYRLTELGLARLRAAVYRRDNFTCQLCGATVLDPDELNLLHETYSGDYQVMVSRIGKKTGNPVGPWILTLDHIVRLVDGGHPNSPTNLRAACAPCNHNRKHSPEEDALIVMPDIEWRHDSRPFREPALRVKNRLFELEREERAVFQAEIFRRSGFSCTNCGRTPDHDVLAQLHDGYDGSYPVNVRVSENTIVKRYAMLIVRRAPGCDSLDPDNYDAVCTLCSLGFAV